MKKNCIVNMFIVVGIILFSGCAQPLQPISHSNNFESKQVIDKSYTIGEEKTAFIGESMIRVKDYTLIEKSSDIMKASENFVFNEKFSFSKGDSFQIEGEFSLDGEYFTAVSNPKLLMTRLLVNDDGVLHNKVINQIPYGPQTGQYVPVIYTYTYYPTSVRLITEKIIETKINPGNMNFELIYTGKDKESIKLLYREYTSDDMARSSYYQTLTYDLNSKKIRFKNLTMQINQTDNEKINFTVISDK